MVTHQPFYSDNFSFSSLYPNTDFLQITKVAMDMKNLLSDYVNQKYMMQLATVSNGQPWSCIVYYVTDDELNLYWASIPSRRHSQEIKDCDSVSISIAVKHEKGQKVVGIQAEGTARVVENHDEIKPIAKKYASEFGRDGQWPEDFSALKTEHRLYKFTPKKLVLFDEQNFPHDPRQEITP